MSATTRRAARRTSVPGHPTRAQRAAIAIVGLVVLLSLLPLAEGTLQALSQGNAGDLFFYLVFLVLPANLGMVGVVLAVRRPENRIGWLLLAAGALAGVAFACGEYERFALAAGATDASLFVPAAWLASWLFIPAIGILVVFLPLLFPTGKLPSARWRIVAAIGLFGVAFGALGPAFAPGPLGDPRGPLNPWVLPEPFGGWLETASGASNAIAPPIFILSLASLLRRFRHSAGIERQQIKWFLFVASLATAAFAASVLNVGPISDVAWVLGILTMSLLPLAIGLAILRYGLYEIDRIVNRAIVYGAVTAILAGVFAAATALSQRLFISVAGQSSDSAVVLTTLVVVAIYAPVRKRVESVVDRYFKYDQREYGPYLDELRRLLDLIEPNRAAARLAREAIRHTGATAAAVVGADQSVLGTAGAWPSPEKARVQMSAGGVFAAVLLGERPDGKPIGNSHLRALEDAAAVAAIAATLSPATPAHSELRRSGSSEPVMERGDIDHVPEIDLDGGVTSG